MRNLRVGRVVEVNLTAHQWMLYTGADYPDAPEIAHKMNVALQQAVNSGWTRDRVERHMRQMFELPAFEHYGARDTAVVEVLGFVLDDIFRGADPGDAVEAELAPKSTGFVAAAVEAEFYRQVKAMVVGMPAPTRAATIAGVCLTLDMIGTLPVTSENLRQDCIRLREQINELL